MKKLFYTLLVLCYSTFAFSQGMDTLIYENFQVDPSDQMAFFPDDNTSDVWINWDEDGLPAAESADSDWFQDTDWGQVDSIPPTDTNFIFRARSWLESFDTSSSNWLITPAIDIIDDQATLHWSSAPFQGPRYMDGYSVRILVGSNSYFDADQNDVVFKAAEMTGWIGDNTSLNLDTFTFSSGYIHAEGFSNPLYFVPPDSTDDAYTPRLEPHSVSLADYAGQTIYVAFHHDSSDDNWIMVDDILLLGTKMVSSTNQLDEADVRFVTYPNPVNNYLNVMYRLREAGQLSLELFDVQGKLVSALPVQTEGIGEYTKRLDLRNLVPGNYTLMLSIDGKTISKKIVKK